MNGKIQFLRVKDLPALELYQAANVNRPVPRHIHCVFSLSVCEAGVGIHETKKGKYYITPGSVVLVNEGAAHSSRVPVGYTYSSRSIRIDPEMISNLVTQISGRLLARLNFSHPVIYNKVLSQQVLNLHKMLENSETRLEKECLLVETLTEIYERYAEQGVKLAAIGNEHTPVSRVCEYLQDWFNENVSLDRLASVAGLSAFHLTRVFTNEIGVLPHTYQLQVRLKKATDLIAAGKPLVEAALETGFCDQSHFQRVFKKRFGISPGSYKKSVPYGKVCYGYAFFVKPIIHNIEGHY